MRILVLYFAVFRERLGRDRDALELTDGATVADAIVALTALHPSIGTMRTSFRTAVNEEFVPESAALSDGDELVLIPPVAGGSGDRHVRLLDVPLSLDRVVAAVRGSGMGGIVTFTGVVRRESRGVTVEKLDYEAYGSMAVREMTKLCDEIERELTGTRLAVEHRVGTLGIGELAVVIAAAAAHRVQAFTACRAMIDRLKDRVPIWKKEYGEDGTTWIGLGP